MKEKSILIIFSILLTSICIYFCIPHFFEKEKIDILLDRMKLWPGYSDQDSSLDENNQEENFEEKNEENLDNEIIDDENNIISDDDIIDDESDNLFNDEKIRTFQASFDLNGAEGTTPETLSCSTSSNSCTITLPSITTNREFLGWSLSKDATSTSLTSGMNVTLSTNRTYYAITRQNYTVTINGNGAFIGTQKRSCSTYNMSSSCTVTLPDLNRDFYTSVGYTTDASSANILYNTSMTLTLTNNLTLYAVRKIDTTSYDQYANVAMEVFNKINSLRASRGLNQLNYSKSLELSAMLRISEIMQNYDFNVNGDYHYRISNNTPFYTVNELALRENYDSDKTLSADNFHARFTNSNDHYLNMMVTDITQAGIAIGFDGEWYYIVELFG